MGDWQDPWHTLVVNVIDIWFCEDANTCPIPIQNPWRAAALRCPGHEESVPEESAPDRYYEPEIQTELIHPESCKIETECCCPKENDPWAHILANPVCLWCRDGNHADCTKLNWEYRCCTEQDVKELYEENDLPRESGTYRVRSSGDGPDYEGDYDQECEWEPITTA